MTEYMTMTADAPISRSTAIKLYDAAGFEGMRKAGRLAAEILDALVPHVVPGVTTGELDDIVRRMTLDGGGVPATLGYRGYTHSCCISLNNVICHGIPGDQKLKEGDILNRSEEHTSELQSLMRISYAVFCLKKKKQTH